MQSRLLVLTFAALCLASATPGLAQEYPAEQNSGAAMTTQALLTELEQAERAMYALFNELNGRDEYEVTCRSERVEALERSIQFCEPLFLKSIRRQVDVELAQDSSAGEGFFARIRSALVSSDRRREELVRERAAASIGLMQREMESLAAANPELAAKLQALGQLLLAYADATARSNSKTAYLMGRNDPGSGYSFSGGSRVSSQPWLGAPPPGHTQPQIHYPADISPRFRP